MTRREWRRWAWAAAAGVAVASGAAAEDWGAKVRGPGDLPKAGDTVTMQFPGEAEKKFTVVKATRKPDGSVEIEYKDPSNGKTFTTVDGPAAAAPGAKPDPAPAAKPAPTGKEAGLPKAKPRAEDPIVSTPAPQADSPAEPPARRTGPLRRLFGKKSSPAPAAPASTPAEPPAVAPKVAVPGKPAAAAVEPPAAMPAKPTPPVNVSVPAPLPPTPAKPAAPARVEPILPPTPGIPVPAPLPPAKPPAGSDAIPVPLPSIPTPGGGQSLKGKPNGGVVPAGYTPADAARAEEIQPHAVALKTAVAPSKRLLAAKALAGCRHASSDAVKGLLFDAAKSDPCPAVRADCIGYLCDLGYFTPAFAEAVQAACDDPSDEVKVAAKAAVARMTRK